MKDFQSIWMTHSAREGIDIADEDGLSTSSCSTLISSMKDSSGLDTSGTLIAIGCPGTEDNAGRCFAVLRTADASVYWAKFGVEVDGVPDNVSTGVSCKGVFSGKIPSCVCADFVVRRIMFNACRTA